MPLISLAALLAAVLFISFHLPVRVLSTGRLPKLIGVSYHLLLLPAVAALPAPAWARAAGMAWMLVDIVLDAGAFVGLPDTVSGPMRQGVHILAALWVSVAGWQNGPLTGVAGTALALVFLVRFVRTGTPTGASARLRHLNAVLNVAWIVALAVTLAR